MNLHLYDSATRSVRAFEPLEPGKVSIYLCGATVQGSPHIGHLRSSLAFDILIRWLRRNNYEVTYVRNITDIDDKILHKSAAAGVPWWAWASQNQREFTAAYQALGILPPTFEPLATAHITDQIELISTLIERDHAYADGKGNVYFAVRSLPDYGSLTRQALDDLATTEDETQLDAQVEAGKRDVRDFSLWKAAKPNEPQTAAWDTPWGRGRPGWHLECSAMSRRYLGETFDIHAGGIDLRFPHHENEQAQSHGAGWGFAQMWLHNAWVTIKGEKMSKSLGNSLIVSQILRTTPAPVLRLALGTVHYRSTVEYSAEILEAAEATWNRFAGFISRASQIVDEITAAELAEVELPPAYVRAMNDDLNLSEALAVIHEHLKAGNTALAEDNQVLLRQILLRLRAMLDILGLDPGSALWAGEIKVGSETAEHAVLDALVTEKLQQRMQARAAKDWAQADAIRDQLAALGIVVEDSSDGARWHLGG